MACQTVIRHLVLGMATHTPAHGHLDIGGSWRFFAFADIPMAGLALHLPKNDMAPVGVEDMIGFSVEAPPGDLLPLLRKLPDLLLFRTLGYRLLVALQTNRDIRHSGEGLGVIVLVAGIASHALLGMLLVVERDRLVGP